MKNEDRSEDEEDEMSVVKDKLYDDFLNDPSQEISEEVPDVLPDSTEQPSTEDSEKEDQLSVATQLQDRIERLERRVSQLEKKSSSGGMQFDRALKEYHRIMDQGREMAKDMLEQRKNDITVYSKLRTVVRGTEKRNIEYGVKGEIQMKRKGIRPDPDPKPFEDTEILKVPKAIKKALRGQEES